MPRLKATGIGETTIHGIQEGNGGRTRGRGQVARRRAQGLSELGPGNGESEIEQKKMHHSIPQIFVPWEWLEVSTAVAVSGHASGIR